MKLIIKILIVLIVKNTDGIRPCNITQFRGQFYEKVILVNNLAWSFSLCVQKNTNFLFYSCVSKDHWPPVQSRYYDLNNDTDHDIPGSINTFVVTVHKNNSVYFGGKNDRGIMKFNDESKHLELAIKAKNFINILTFGKYLYMSRVMWKELYEYKNGNFTLVENFKNIKVIHFLDRRNGDIYYVTLDYIYKIKSGKTIKDSVKLNEVKVDVRQISEDSKGSVYFIGSNAVFVYENNKFKTIANITNIQSLAFDRRDNMYFGDDQSIQKLVRTNKRCPSNRYKKIN